MNPFNIAAEGKGLAGAINRVGSIRGRYGFSPHKMKQILAHFAGVLADHNAGGTFPITAVSLSRNKIDVDYFRSMNIEFAVHGYFHTDYSQLSLETQIDHVNRAVRLFKELGIESKGFRSPYLRWNEDTLAAVHGGDLQYDSSQGLAWELNGGIQSPTYDQVLRFYQAKSAAEYPSLPWTENGLVRIPYCLPDDEAFVERFKLQPGKQMSSIWVSILEATYELGELFTLGLHPERIYLCEEALRDTLTRAQELSPGVWIARLDEIASWWRLRSESAILIEEREDQEIHISVDGPAGAILLAREVNSITPLENWGVDYQLVRESTLRIRTETKPFVGLSTSSSPRLTSFLKQQGYIVEDAESEEEYSVFLHRPKFGRDDERIILSEIEKSGKPLVKLGRWPNGCRSALCITGDIDALTIWDYWLRFFDR